MDSTIREVLHFVQENDVKFIRLAFCDVFGCHKNISIMPGELPGAFTTGIPFDASNIAGFARVDKSDLILFPDAATLSVLPWRPQTGRVVRFFCDVRTTDGQPYESDGRRILRRQVERLANAGYDAKVGAECEFYLFERDENGVPTDKTHDNAGYFDVAPLDRGENVRREICLTLEEMGIDPESSHHEAGPGQNEIDFKYADPLTAADCMITFRNVVRTIAQRNGLFASFSPKPIMQQAGSGFHVNLSLSTGGKNMFASDLQGNALLRDHFMAGVLAHIAEICIVANPTPVSYTRFGTHEAPRYITWSHHNRSQLVRIPATEGEQSRIEVRSPDVACNPYHAIALLLAAGLDGVEKQLPLMKETPYDVSDGNHSDLQSLPATMGEALDAARQSELLNSVLGTETTQKYLALKQAEYTRWEAAEDKAAYEKETYFISL